MHYIRNTICIHANHVREYQSQSWNKFSSLRSLQRSLIQTAKLCEYTPRCQFTPKNLYLEKQRSEKKTGHATVSRIHQLVSSEPVKWSAVPPPLSKADICFTITLRKIFYQFSNQGSQLASDYWQPGALQVFIGNLGLLFPTKLAFWLGLITFRRVGISICVHRFSVISKIMTWVADQADISSNHSLRLCLSSSPRPNPVTTILGRSEAGGEDSMRFPMSACEL